MSDENLKQGVETILIQLALSEAKLTALTEMVLGVFDELLTKEQSRNLQLNFFDQWEKRSKQALDGLRDIVSQKALARNYLDLVESMNYLRQQLGEDT